LFNRHSALFVDKADGDVYPKKFPDKDEKAVQETFQSFYSWNIVYALTRQWIAQDGEFDLDSSWLTTKYSKPERDEWVSQNFQNIYGVSPASFKII